jgi:hypothetical protein
MSVIRYIGVNDVYANQESLEWQFGTLYPGDKIKLKDYETFLKAKHWYVLPNKTKWGAAWQYGLKKFDRVYKVSGELVSNKELPTMLNDIEVFFGFTIIEEITNFSDPETIDWTDGGWDIACVFPEYAYLMPDEYKIKGPPPYASHLF